MEDDEPYLSPAARAELDKLINQPPPADSYVVQQLKSMIAAGHSMEAAEHAKLLAYSEAVDAHAMVLVLADAILNPVKRKRGDKFNSRLTLEKLSRQAALARLVENAIDESKSRSRGGRKKHVAKALKKVGQDMKLGTSAGTAKRSYYAHKNRIPSK